MLAISSFGLYAAAVKSGAGRHMLYLSPDQQMQTVKFLYLSQFPCVASIMCTKMSICLFLLRFFKSNNIWKKSLYSLGVFVIITQVSSICAILLQCRPVERNWTLAVRGTCWSHEVFSGLDYYQGSKFSQRDPRRRCYSYDRKPFRY